jgi:hypothetical protein
VLHQRRLDRPSSFGSDQKGVAMKFALFRIGGDSIVECPTMDEVWTYVRANGLCSGDARSRRANFGIYSADALGKVN